MDFLSHLHPINQSRGGDKKEPAFLADAFAEFIASSSKLELSYSSLQREVSHLSGELVARNLALKASLDENERVHEALRSIVDSLPCGVMVVEADSTVSIINSEARKLLDLGQNVAEHLAAISSAAGIDLSAFLRHHAGVGQEQEFCKATEAGERWIAVHDRCLRREDGAGQVHTRQTILILRDITLHKQAEVMREGARKATALSEIAFTLAHEIRNPLASLELFTSLIAAGDENAGEWIAHLHAGIRSLAGTVNNVLSFHGVGFPSLAPLDLVASIRSSVEFTRPIADQAGVALIFDAEDQGIWVRGSSSGLQQVVLNMVCNAVRHTAAGGHVLVAVRRAQRLNHGTVEFRDTGRGIAPKDLPYIFDAGFSAGGDSSGLGLAVCRRIAEQHGGSIRVESTPGVGTCFSFEVPAL